MNKNKIMKLSILLFFVLFTFMLCGCTYGDELMTIQIVDGDSTREITIEQYENYSITSEREDFYAWTEDGVIVSYDRSYHFTVWISHRFESISSEGINDLEKKIYLSSSYRFIDNKIQMFISYTNPEDLDTYSWGIYYTTFEEDFSQKDYTMWTGLQELSGTCRTLLNEFDMELEPNDYAYVCYLYTDNSKTNEKNLVLHVSDIKYIKNGEDGLSIK